MSQTTTKMTRIVPIGRPTQSTRSILFSWKSFPVLRTYSSTLGSCHTRCESCVRLKTHMCITVCNCPRSHSKYISALLLLFVTTSQTLFIEASKLSQAEFPYNSVVVPFLTEICKLAISLCLLLSESGKDGVLFQYSFQRHLSYGIPGFCYFVSNNCVLLVIRDLGASLFQTLNNLKILFVALLMQYVMKKRISYEAWRALIILVIGSTVIKSSPSHVESPSNSKRGYLALLFGTFFSALGSVYSEKLLKQRDDKSLSIHGKNLQLYSFGIIFGFVPVFGMKGGVSDVFEGFNVWTYLAICTGALGGQLVSFVLKYLDNNVKSFVVVCSMLLVAVISTVSNNEIPSTRLLVGITLTGVAVLQYTKCVN